MCKSLQQHQEDLAEPVVAVRDDETLDAIGSGGLRIIQARHGYRYSIDPFLLVAFARIPAGARVADLGSGSGIISLLVATRTEASEIVGLERQETLYERSCRSIALNRLQRRVTVISGDVRFPPAAVAADCFAAVLINPPYRGPATGRLSQGSERCQARHELAGGLIDFLAAAAGALQRRGRVFIIFPAQRLAELLAAMCAMRLEPKRVRTVHSRQGEPARLVLVEGGKNGKPGLGVESPLILYQGPGRDYSPEALLMLHPDQGQSRPVDSGPKTPGDYGRRDPGGMMSRSVSVVSRENLL